MGLGPGGLTRAGGAVGVLSDLRMRPIGSVCVPLSQLTPAGQNELSDFRSEPALYF